MRILGIPNPYMVLMDFNVQSVQAHATALGFDAISTYALPGGTKEVNRSSFLDKSGERTIYLRVLHLFNYFNLLNSKRSFFLSHF